MSHKKVNNAATWMGALMDARKQLEAAKLRVRELAAAVRVCEERVKTKEPFPGFLGQTTDYLGRRPFMGKAAMRLSAEAEGLEWSADRLAALRTPESEK